MTKKVLISLHSMQFSRDGAETDHTEAVMSGIYYEKNGGQYILYEEVMEGFREPVKNQLKYKEHILELSRSGPINVRMVFEEKKKHRSDYHTPYGNIILDIDTKTLCIVNEADKITVNVDYTLAQNDEYLADCRILMEVRSQ